MRTVMTRAARPAVLALVAVAALAGSGSGGGPKAAQVASAPGGKAHASASASATGGFDLAAWTTYARCLREHGVDVKDPNPDSGTNQTSILVMADGSQLPLASPAWAACQFKAPQQEALPPQQISAGDLAKLRKAAKCMREHGVPEYLDGASPRIVDTLDTGP